MTDNEERAKWNEYTVGAMQQHYLDAEIQKARDAIGEFCRTYSRYPELGPADRAVEDYQLEWTVCAITKGYVHTGFLHIFMLYLVPDASSPLDRCEDIVVVGMRDCKILNSRYFFREPEQARELYNKLVGESSGKPTPASLEDTTRGEREDDDKQKKSKGKEQEEGGGEYDIGVWERHWREAQARRNRHNPGY